MEQAAASNEHPRQSTKEVSVTEFSFVFCKRVFNKTYPTVVGKLSKLRNSSHHCSCCSKKPSCHKFVVVVHVDMSLESKYLFEPCLRE